ncbi:unnamed protein product [Schistosoma spindalis]|nr:unnamed protein product [Schistosoma spindale]
MKTFFIGIIGIISLLISQEYGYTVDINMNNPKQKQYLRSKLNSLNEYLRSREINKQFTEDEFYKIIYDRINKHIEDENTDIHIIEKTDKQPIQKEVSKRPVTKPVNNGTSDKTDKQPIQKEVSKRPVTKPVNNGTSDKTDKQPIQKPVNNGTSDKTDKQPIQKPVNNGTSDKTDKQPIQKPVNNGTSDKSHSISDIFFSNKPTVPLWIVNPLYYITEKFIQILAFLLQDDNVVELQMPTYYYDTSI